MFIICLGIAVLKINLLSIEGRLSNLNSLFFSFGKVLYYFFDNFVFCVFCVLSGINWSSTSITFSFIFSIFYFLKDFLPTYLLILLNFGNHVFNFQDFFFNLCNFPFNIFLEWGWSQVIKTKESKSADKERLLY